MKCEKQMYEKVKLTKTVHYRGQKLTISVKPTLTRALNRINTLNTGYSKHI